MVASSGTDCYPLLPHVGYGCGYVDTPTAPETGGLPGQVNQPPPASKLKTGDTDTPTAPEPAAAPQVDTDFARRLADDGLEPFDLRRCIRRLADELDTLREAGKVVVADADAAWAEVARQRTELDTHRARHAELVALVAEWRTAPPSLALFRMAANTLARILGEQP